MIDHGRFDRESAFLIEEHLIVRLTVFACEDYLTLVHEFLRLIIGPTALLDGRHSDRIFTAHAYEKRHLCGCSQIYIFDRRLQYCHALVKSLGHGASFRHQQEVLSVNDVKILVTAFVDVHAELCGKISLKLGFEGETRYLRRLSDLGAHRLRCLSLIFRFSYISGLIVRILFFSLSPLLCPGIVRIVIRSA